MRTTGVVSIAVVTDDKDTAQHLFRDTLGIDFEGTDRDYVFTSQLTGIDHFGIWPLWQAADACFGTREWPESVPVPTMCVDLEVGSAEEVEAAARELTERGLTLLHPVKTEPWGQVITRFMADNGWLVGVSHAPEV